MTSKLDETVDEVTLNLKFLSAIKDFSSHNFEASARRFSFFNLFSLQKVISHQSPDIHLIVDRNNLIPSYFCNIVAISKLNT